LVLQSCSDPLHVQSSSSSETCAISDGLCNVSNIKVEEDEHLIEEVFTAINEEADKDIKQEIAGVMFPDINSDPDGVSYVCV
jgi:hypothetical protein